MLCMNSDMFQNAVVCPLLIYASKNWVRRPCSSVPKVRGTQENGESSLSFEVSDRPTLESRLGAAGTSPQTRGTCESVAYPSITPLRQSTRIGKSPCSRPVRLPTLAQKRQYCPPKTARCREARHPEGVLARHEQQWSWANGLHW